MEKDLIRALDEMGNLADQYLRERDAAEARVAELEAWLARVQGSIDPGSRRHRKKKELI